ncbi:kinase-like domain-containing protein [Mycena filopes]|nr:kinase-like domain-containing protein [Mycena filopes]
MTAHPSANLSAVDYAGLFAKETPSAPVGSPPELVQRATIFYRSEHEAYLRLNGHPGVLRYHGWDRRGLLFDSHPAGDILLHLLENRDSPPSLSVRLQWACDIAEALAFVHSKGVIWVDVSLNNVLLSADQRAIICDFAGSCILPVFGRKVLPSDYALSQISIPPIMRMPRYPHARFWKGPGSPDPYPDWNFTPHDDRFGFGILLFSLLAFRFPHSPHLAIRDIEVFQRIYELHQNESFDTLGEIPEYRDLEGIIQKCFRAQYEFSDDLLKDVRAAYRTMVRISPVPIPLTIVMTDSQPTNAPLLQDKVLDPVVEFPAYPRGRHLYPER